MSNVIALTDTGLIHNVNLYVAGATLNGDHALGSTILTVDDASDFHEEGGTLTVTSYDAVNAVYQSTDYTYVSADLGNDVIQLDVTGGGLVLDATDGDRVDVSPRSLEKHAQVVIDGTDEAVTARVPHYLNDLIAEGPRDEGARESVVITLVNDGWVITDMPGRVAQLRSSDYEEGSAGWGLDDETVQFSNANVIGDFGADRLSANTILIGDQDLQADILDGRPTGVIAQYSSPGTGVDTADVSAATMMLVFSASGIKAGRVYKISYGVPILGTVTNDLFFIRIYQTEDGTTPAIATGTIQNGSICPIQTLAGQTVLGEHTYYYYPTADVDTLKIGFVLVRTSGSGTAHINMTNENLVFYCAVEDAGSADAVVGSLSQKSKAGGGTADPDPVSTYTRTWFADSSASYDGDNGKRTGAAGTPDCYQGYYSSTHGNTKSIVCFDDADIRSKLSGATIKSVKLTFRVKHSYYNAGLDVRIKNHNHSSPPTTYSAGSAIDSRDDCREGSTYTVSLPISFGTDLRDGNARGVSFYGPTTAKRYYGYMYGPGSGSAPRLTITYAK